MTQAAREKADGMARQMLDEMPLNELRQTHGGELDVIARFPDGSVKINNFTDLGAATPL